MLRWNKEEHQYELYPYTVTFTKRGVEHTQYALPNKSWWIKTANLHEHIDIVEFKQIDITQDMQERFDKIKNFDEYNLALRYIEGEELTQDELKHLV